MFCFFLGKGLKTDKHLNVSETWTGEFSIVINWYLEKDHETSHMQQNLVISVMLSSWFSC